MENKKAIVNQQVNIVHWEHYSYSTAQTRQYFCNAILFKNQGTDNVYINDVYTIAPGDSEGFSCDQNEIDTTIYKITFEPGATTNKLAVAVKINSGVTQMIYNQQRLIVSPGSRRAQNKAYIQRRKRGDF